MLNSKPWCPILNLGEFIPSWHPFQSFTNEARFKKKWNRENFYFFNFSCGFSFSASESVVAHNHLLIHCFPRLHLLPIGWFLLSIRRCVDEFHPIWARIAREAILIRNNFGAMARFIGKHES
jgi:hypothetical protein